MKWTGAASKGIFGLAPATKSVATVPFERGAPLMNDVMNFSNDDLQLIQTLMYITSVLSISGCLFIILSYLLKYKEKRDFTAKMVFVMSCIDLTDASFKLFGTMGYTRPWFCNIQGFFMNSMGISGVTWLACMACTWYRWIVRRDDELKLQSWFPYFVGLAFLPSIAESLYLGFAGKYGPAGFYCWIGDDYGEVRVYFFFTWVFAAALAIMTIAVLVWLDVSRRTKSQENHEATHASSLIFSKLTAYVAIFLVVWGPCIVNRLVQFASGETLFDLFVIHIVCNNSQGTLNAIVYGGVLQAARRAIWGRKHSVTETHTSDETAGRPTISFLEPETPGITVSIFATTFNMGEGPPPADLAQWIPLGHDIYVIGVQECLPLAELRAATKAYLEAGMGRPFVEYSREIGSKNTMLGYHGYIAITVYVSEYDVEHDNFHMPTPSKSEVNCGKTLNFRTSNKGGVGFAFRYMDTSIAVVSCHLSSDTKGKSNTKRRNEDAALIWQSLHLSGGDAMGIEFPLLHHHTIMMGDFNYRLARFHATPQTIVDLVEQAMAQTKKWPLTMTPPPTSASTAASTSSPSSFLHPRQQHLSPPAPTTMASSPGSATSHVRTPTTTMSADHHIRRFTRRTSGAWALVLNHDELHMLMEDGMGFAGFDEALIAFPPTFRRIRETSLLTAMDVAAAYSLEVPNGGGVRVPSYTDRILYHSMSDVEYDLVCSEYRCHESVETSDHKPVSCVFHITTRARRCRSIVMEMSAVDGVGAGQPPWTGRMTDIEGVRDCIISLSQLRWTSAIKPRASDDLAGKWDDPAQYEDVELCTLFPLPLEDIFAEQRKLHQLAAAWHTGLAGSPTAAEQSKHLSYLRVPWNTAREKGFVHRCFAQTKRHMHIALDIRSPTMTLGQCVLNLNDAFTRPNIQTTFEVALSAGGVKTGMLKGKLVFRVGT
ncbi:Aste57867_20109 [Aphanomyces stellatus]|uniref:Aste57867_20109 protein n=1 Tax=Aphanomyces stellatus TaxID=120398 RepID=A0A485LIW0_9STRA|nr:hypothetical protein As57867_020043 [Aphanomyces stellatus]VFT96804.1 Aste57867_20109 [Aphanomyces stellatus]